MSNRLKFVIFILLASFLSFQYSSFVRARVVGVGNIFIENYLALQRYIKEGISNHFNQKETIVKLKEENKKLEQSSLLLVAFAGKLNQILQDNHRGKFEPKLQLVQALSYEQISNYNRIWIGMNDFNSSKIYGLISKGNTAGIVISKNKKPLGLLQGDYKCVFSVIVGKDKFPGVATGRGKFIHVRYIPSWMNPKVGDEVITSGLDNIFPLGFPVGKVVEIKKEESYQTAIVEPNIKINSSSFFYVIK
ncbi:MAG: rod shape-determining protein MreC [Proteobacteria bacterium]|nr:MAG: rod shape-determining protein MreC [Pseudomonadota bacterium]